MKENLQTLLQFLQVEKDRLESDKRDLARQSNVLIRSRTTVARRCIERFVPDLEMSTIKMLLRRVSGFKVPTVSSWFGFVEKVAPHVTLDSLRMQLGVYLDTTSGVVPPIWQDEVRTIDDSIRNLQENLIGSNAEHIADIDKRIVALKKLLQVDVDKMDPKVRARLEEAVASQVDTFRQSSSPYIPLNGDAPVAISYPSAAEINSSSGPDLLEVWLWGEILSPQSASSQEMQRIEFGGGDFGGAGASGGWDERPDTSSAAQTDFSASDSSPLPHHAADHATEAQLAAQADLGSQSFS